MRNVIALLIAVLASGACGGGGGGVVIVPPDTAATMLAAINAQRTAAGLTPYTLVPAIAAAAQDRAEVNAALQLTATAGLREAILAQGFDFDVLNTFVGTGSQADIFAELADAGATDIFLSAEDDSIGIGVATGAGIQSWVIAYVESLPPAGTLATMTERLNSLREDRGLEPFAEDDTVLSVAFVQAQENRRVGEDRITTDNGLSFLEQLEATGEGDRFADVQGMAGNGSDEEVFNQWLAEHEALLVDPSFTRMGLSRDGDGIVKRWVLVLAQPQL